MKLSDDFLSDIRFRNPIEDVIGQYVELKTAGNTMKGLCPFHNEKTASFTVYPNTASYYCFGCQNGGDVITFIRQIENLDYLEAVKTLADRCGMSMPEEGYDDSAERLRKRVLSINKETAKFYNACLKNPEVGAKGYRYFKERGLTDKTMSHFGLGYAPDTGFALCNHLRSLGFSENDMIIANVAGKSRNGHAYDRFRGKMMFPLIDLRGNVIAFGGRKFPGEEGGKYINTSDTPVYKKSRNIFALNFAKNAKSDTLILCEGYMDVISLHQAGFENAVAALGTAFTEEQASLLARYAKEIIVTMDSDGPGQKATQRAISILQRTGMKIRVLQIDGGKDPDEFIKTYGAERFKLLLDGAKNDIEFRLLKEKSNYDLDTDDGRLRYSEAAVGVLASVSNDIARDLYAGRLADELKINKQIIITQINAARKRAGRAAQKSAINELIKPKTSRNDVNPEAAANPAAAKAEEYILCIMMRDPALLKKARGQIDAESFVTSFNRRIFESIIRADDSSGEFSLTHIGADFLPEEMGKISAIYNTGIASGEEVLDDCIERLKKEKNKQNNVNVNDMSDDEFSLMFKNIKDKK